MIDEKNAEKIREITLAMIAEAMGKQAGRFASIRAAGTDNLIRCAIAATAGEAGLSRAVGDSIADSMIPSGAKTFSGVTRKWRLLTAISALLAELETLMMEEFEGEFAKLQAEREKISKVSAPVYLSDRALAVVNMFWPASNEGGTRNYVECSAESWHNSGDFSLAFQELLRAGAITPKYDPERENVVRFYLTPAGAACDRGKGMEWAAKTDPFLSGSYKVKFI